MSLAHTAIRRPITMYMICGIIVLLGAISLARPKLSRRAQWLMRSRSSALVMAT